MAESDLELDLVLDPDAVHRQTRVRKTTAEILCTARVSRGWPWALRFSRTSLVAGAVGWIGIGIGIG